MNIKGIYVGRSDENTLQYKCVKQDNKQLQKDIGQLPNKIKALNSKSGERDKINTPYGAWFVTKKNGWTYGVCTLNDYPERHAFGLIGKIREFVQTQNTSDKKFLKELKKTVDENCKKYQTLSDVDKVHKALEQVNLLKGDLNTGIKKVIDGGQKLQDLDVKAAKMKNLASEFYVNSQKLQSITWWHKMKKFLWIIALIGFASLIGLWFVWR